MNSSLVLRLRASRPFAAFLGLSTALLAQDQTVSGNLNVTGNSDLEGNTLSLGAAGANPGVILNYTDGTPATVSLSATRNGTNWVWQTNTGKAQMQLSSGNKLQLFDQTATPVIKITLDPLGTSSFSGPASFGGTVIVTGALNANGGLGLPGGTTAAQGLTLGGDTNLYRAAPGILNTDNSFQVGNNLNVGGNFSISGKYGADGTRSTLAFGSNYGSFGEPGSIYQDSPGDKLVLYNSQTGANFDARMGVGASANVWFKAGYSNASYAHYEWYTSTAVGNNIARIMDLSNNGLNIQPTTVSTLPTNGALIVAGGAGIAGSLNVGGILNVAGNTTSATSAVGVSGISALTVRPFLLNTAAGQPVIIAQGNRLSGRYTLRTETGGPHDILLDVIGSQYSAGQISVLRDFRYDGSQQLYNFRILSTTDGNTVQLVADAASSALFVCAYEGSYPSGNLQLPPGLSAPQPNLVSSPAYVLTPFLSVNSANISTNLNVTGMATVKTKVRVPASGDLSMGSFTTGSNPATQ